jgi:hypothetical protein
MSFSDEIRRQSNQIKFYVDITVGSTTYKYCSGRDDGEYSSYPMKIASLSVGASALASVQLSIGDKDFTWTALVESIDTIQFPVTITVAYGGFSQQVFSGVALQAARADGFINFNCSGSALLLRQSPRLKYRSAFANVVRGSTVTIGSEIFTFE